MSFRYGSSIVKPGFNPLGTQTTTLLYNLFAWGVNTNGQLGLGNTTAYSSPKQVGSLTNWSVISAAGELTTAIKTDGTLWSWGYNADGQLGDNTTVAKSSPIQVGSLTTWSNLGWSKAHVGIGAIKTDGTLWTWGSNGSGQLGLGNVVARSSPVQVGALTDWLQVAGCYNACAAIKTDGTLWTWGLNNEGQLGIGSAVDKSSPVQVGALTNWSQIAGGLSNTFLAITTGGTLYGWGAAFLGDNTAVGKNSPVQIGALTNWSKVSVGLYSSAAIKTDGTLWGWGRNDNGAIGLGNTTYFSSPVQVGSSTTWANVSSSGYWTIAIG
jgi:YD repeat-containing protein